MGGKNREEALENYRENDDRRALQFKSFLIDKDVVDIGCGAGGFLDRIKPYARSVAGVEPQKYMRAELTAFGHSIYPLTKDLPSAAFDVATLFYTLEHMVEPIETLIDVHKSLRPGGILIVEVPHARDVLLELESFRKFSLWSEHLILHTKESLQVFLEAAGFSNIQVTGYQRYPLANHLGWLATGAPNGQKNLPELLDKSVATAYEQLLMKHDRTDTLIAIAQV